MAFGSAHAESGMAAKPAARFDDWATVFLSLLLLLPLLIYRVILVLKPLPRQDCLIYWAAGRLFLFGGDPYSISSLRALERAAGWTDAVPLPMLYPPWVLPFFAPLGVLPFWPAHYLAFTISLGIEILCSLALWDYFGGEKRQRWIGVLVLLTFLPAASAEHYGQVTPLILGGLTIFLLALRRQWFVLAGAPLVLFAVKPHLLYLVLLAILLWSVQNRRWAIPVSATLCGLATTIASIAFNRNVLNYFHGTVHAALVNPCGVGSYLRLVFGGQHEWLQFLPCVVGLAWFVGYWMRHRGAWTWEERLPLLLLASIGSAAYFWKHDFILGLPAVIALAIQVARARVWLIAAFLYLAVQLIILSASDTVHECVLSLLWIALYWFLSLVCARRLEGSNRDELPAPAAGRAIAVEG
jgi:hypothetical protein